MQSAVANLQPVSAQPSAGRRLLSRLTSGLAAKPRNFADFHIKLEEEGRQYSTGDLIKGSVRINVLRPTRITHIVVSLSGRAQVYKNPIAPGEHRSSNGLSTTGRGKTTGQYHGNGLATLFEDEVILCGDGRLVDGAYSFEFALEFPDRDLPTSVDFERGKIWYTITATITRPTTISPTTTCERDISFVERIDIAPLFPPKARNIILDPISKRSRGKSLKRIDTTDRRSLKLPDERQDVAFATNSVGAPPVTESSTMGRSVSSQDGDRSRSPVPSELSIDSHVSSSVGIPSHNGGGSMTALPSPSASFVSRPAALGKNGMHAPRTIGTTIESCSGGCLRGDILSVKVSVHHVKYVKSMMGVIVTLYRHARIDTQPALSVGPLDSQGKSESKQSTGALQPSRTGLSGLSLTGAGSAHIFRKDLAQNIAPLVINPVTFTADVLVKLRVPEQDCFPTISSVPGAMMSFKYYVEVIVDIQGKLAGSSTMGPLRELTSTSMAPPAELYEVTGGATSTRPIDTNNIRRDKSVVCSLFELIIGTVDTERKGKKRAITNVEEQQQQQQQQQQQHQSPQRSRQHSSNQTPLPSPPIHPPAFESVQAASNEYSRPGLLGREYSGTYLPYPEHAYQQRLSGYQDQTPSTPPPFLPIPQLAEESQLSEKERIRLAETRLLPSQPPGMNDENGQDHHDENDASEEIVGATAPHLIEDYDNSRSENHVMRPAGNGYFASETLPSGYVDGAGLERYETAQRLYSNGHGEPQDPAMDSGDQVPWTQGSEHFAAQGGNDHHAGSSSTAPQYTTASETTSSETAHDSHADASASAGLPRYER